MPRIWSFLSRLKIEPYVLLHTVGSSVSGVTTSLLLQDKLCAITYDQPQNFCIDLNAITLDDDPQNIKDKILSESTVFGLYGTLLTTIPAIIFSMFFGSWTDKYIHGRKILLSLSSLGSIVTTALHIINAIYFNWDPYFLLLNTLPYALTGGFMASLMAIYSYVSYTTPEHLRSVRYTIIELCSSLGAPLGTFIGGQILKNTPNSTNGHLHNYVTIFTITITLQIVAFIYLLIVINEKKPIDETSPLLGNDINENRESVSGINDCDDKPDNDGQNRVSSNNKWYHPLKLLFDTQNIREVWICCTKRRENHGRSQIWIMIGSMCFIVISISGLYHITFQFCERVYLWSATFYSNVSSISSLVNTLVMTIVVPIFVLKLKISDINMSIIGVLSFFFKYLAIGSIQHPFGYYISIIIGSLTGLTTISIRAKLSKLVAKDELGKVFSLLSTLESITPTISSLFLTFLFQQTITFYPGLIFEVSAAILFVPLIAIMWIELNTVRTNS